MVPLEYELYAIFYNQRAMEALYLLKNDWFTGVYGALVARAGIPTRAAVLCVIMVPKRGSGHHKP